MLLNRLYLTSAVLACCWGGAAISVAQTTAYSQPQVAIPQPIYVLNSSVIINGPALSEVAPKDIEEVRIYKGDAADQPAQLRNLGPAGIVDLKSSKRVKGQSFAGLGKQLGIKGPVLFALNGQPLDTPAVAGLRIAPAAIGQLHIIRPTTGQPATLVDIWLAPIPKTKSTPGTIMIRGVAGS